MAHRVAKPDAIQDLLKKKGFHFEKLDDSEDEVEALYIKTRAGGVSIYVTVPINRDFILENVVKQIMETARIPKHEYTHLWVIS